MDSDGLRAAQPGLGRVASDVGVPIDHHQLEGRLRLIKDSCFIHRDLRLQLKKVDEGVPDLVSICRSLIRDRIDQTRRPGCHLVNDQFAGESEKQKDQQENQGYQIRSAVHLYKEYSPPHPLDTKGCCSPQNNP